MAETNTRKDELLTVAAALAAEARGRSREEAHVLIGSAAFFLAEAEVCVQARPARARAVAAPRAPKRLPAPAFAAAGGDPGLVSVNLEGGA